MNIENIYKGMYVMDVTQYEHATCTGACFKVIAVSAPFVMVDDLCGRQFAFDVRDVDLSRPSTQYLRAYLRSLKSTGCTANTGPGKKNVKPVRFLGGPSDLVSQGQVAVLPDRLRCNNCGGPIVQRLDQERHTWYRICNQCGFKPLEWD